MPSTSDNIKLGLFSESINVSARCDCPKACYVRRYRVSTSYASANQNKDSRVTLSDKLLRKLGENVNRSIDTREYFVPERRQANIDEALKAGGNVSVLIERRVDGPYGIMKTYVDDILGKSYNFIMEAGFQKMEDILRYRFIAAWDNIGVYEWMYGSYELSQIIAHSLDKIHQESWREAIRLSLGKQLLASKRTLHNLDRVHSAYSNGVPLSMYNTTPCEWYDTFYLTTLFRQNIEVNKTYTRVRGHVTTCIDHIDALLNLTRLDVGGIGERNYLNEYLSYTKGLAHASDSYAPDMRLYEWLIIRLPLQLLSTAKRKFVDLYKGRISAMDTGNRHDVVLLKLTLSAIFNIFRTFNDDIIATYLQHLKQGRYVSKLDLAERFMSESITRVLSSLTAHYAHVSQLRRHYIRRFQEVNDLDCTMNRAVSREPALQPLFAKLFDRYEKANNTEKEEMVVCFKLDVLHRDMLVHGNIFIDKDGSMHASLCPLKQLSIWDDLEKTELTLYIWLNNLSSFRTKLERFLQGTRLEGTFLR